VEAPLNSTQLFMLVSNLRTYRRISSYSKVNSFSILGFSAVDWRLSFLLGLTAHVNMARAASYAFICFEFEAALRHHSSHFHISVLFDSFYVSLSDCINYLSFLWVTCGMVWYRCFQGFQKWWLLKTLKASIPYHATCHSQERKVINTVWFVFVYKLFQARANIVL